MRTSLTALVTALLLFAAASVAGCGLKGDLYLPEEDAAQETSAPDDEEGDGQSSPPSA